MASALEDIRREVSEAKAGMESARVMLVALRDRLDQMVDESANYRELSEAVAGLANELSDSTDALSAAVEEPGSDEVPADPVEPEEPEVPEEPSDEAP